MHYQESDYGSIEISPYYTIITVTHGIPTFPDATEYIKTIYENWSTIVHNCCTDEIMTNVDVRSWP